MNETGVTNLAAAIVRQAVIDYESALHDYNTQNARIKKDQAKYTIKECERFFRNSVELYVNVDGDSIIKAIRDRVRKKLAVKGIVMEVPDDSKRII